MTTTIDIIAGARPNFMKIAPIIRALEAHKAAGGPLEYRLVHTGQHYDACMSGDFFSQLGIPEPDVNLGVGSGTQAEQAAAIMVGYERLLLDARSSLCLVVGDVTSTMACAIAAQKLCIPVAHVEAGIRSCDWTMPEEINRMVTDSITNWFFTTSEASRHFSRNPKWGPLRFRERKIGDYYAFRLPAPVPASAAKPILQCARAHFASLRGYHDDSTPVSLPCVFPLACVKPQPTGKLPAYGYAGPVGHPVLLRSGQPKFVSFRCGERTYLLRWQHYD